MTAQGLGHKCSPYTSTFHPNFKHQIFVHPATAKCRWRHRDAGRASHDSNRWLRITVTKMLLHGNRRARAALRACDERCVQRSGVLTITRSWPTTGAGTDAAATGLGFSCAFNIAYVDLQSLNVTTSCKCVLYVAMPEAYDHRFLVDGCTCVGPFTATMPPKAVANVIIADSVRPIGAM